MKRIPASIFLLFLLLMSWGSVNAQTLDTKYFSETGHNVSGDFLNYYNNTPNASYLFGYPITEQFTSKDGKVVQYFQRARFEFHTDFPAGQQVQLTSVGQEMYTPAGVLNVGNSFACRTYSETGFSICFAFLEYFDANGGVASFGYPISGFEYHENKIVQYFEKARLEWQPWKAEGYRVVLSDLGRAYFDKLGEDVALLAPVSPLNNAPRVISELRVRSFVWKSVTLASDSQLFFVVVQDQNMQPVPNAACSAVVNWPNGAQDSTDLKTDENGIGVFSLAFQNQPYGNLIYTNINCFYSGLTGNTVTSFRIWY